MFRFKVAFSNDESELYETYDEMIEELKKELKVDEFDGMSHNELLFGGYGEFVLSDCDGHVVDVVGYFWWEEKDEA